LKQIYFSISLVLFHVYLLYVRPFHCRAAAVEDCK